MNFKRTLCLALILTTICCAGLTSCGNNDNDNSSKTENVAASVSVDVISVADKLKSEIEYKDSLNELSADMVQKLFGLAADTDYVKGKVYVGSGRSNRRRSRLL